MPQPARYAVPEFWGQVNLANEEHLKWLLEGVEAWNNRRRSHDFTPRLIEANLIAMDLRRANLKGADLRGASLVEADLLGADLVGANLEGADLRDANLRETILRATRVGTVLFPPTAISSFLNCKYTDLSTSRYITQEQLDEMQGDRGAKIPEDLHYPHHWSEIQLNPTQGRGAGLLNPAQETPSLPENPQTGNNVAIDEARLRIVPEPFPERGDLAAVYEDLSEDLRELHASRSFANISPILSRKIERLADIVEPDFEGFDQTRFGVQTQTLRTLFNASRDEIDQIDKEKVASLDAILLAAELLTARLPGWVEFLRETENEAEPVEENSDIVDEALEEAEIRMREDPEHFDPSLPETLAEHRNSEDPVGRRAGIRVITNALYAVAKKVWTLGSRAGGKLGDKALEALATAVVADLGAAIMKLAGVLPKELHWAVQWIDYLAKAFAG